MAGFSAPSFSLGIDLDLDLPDIPTDGEDPPLLNSIDRSLPPEIEEEDRPFRSVVFDSASPSEIEGEEGRSLRYRASDSDGAPTEPYCRALKRLRRGPPPSCFPPSASLAPDPSPSAREFHRRVEIPLRFSNSDDEIEDFSSQEEDPSRQDDGLSSREIRSACGSSKSCLRFNGILTSQSTKKVNARKEASFSLDSSVYANLESSSSKKLLPKLKISPIRKIYLLDSDSDDPSSGNGEGHGMSEQIPFMSASNKEKSKTLLSSRKLHTETLLTDINLQKKINVSTPALDEFCEEYFGKSKHQNFGFNNDDSLTAGTSFGHSVVGPPCHQYFCHGDARIANLVRERLPYFVPLPESCCGENEHYRTKCLDYMCQFRLTDLHTKAFRSNNIVHEERENSWTGNQTNLSSMDMLSGSQINWRNIRNNSTVPEQAGQKRVRANGCQSGRWFTSPEGRKVYVTKTGQELTGQVAYRHFRKESRLGIQKRKKAIRKKNGAVKKKKMKEKLKK